MLNAIVAQSDEYRNCGFENFTPDEHAEYAAWSDEANAGTRDSLPEDFISYRERIAYDLWNEAQRRTDYIPFDETLDQKNDLSDWTLTDGRIDNPDEVRMILMDLPNGAKTAINDCDVWKQSPIAYNARYTPNENWRVQGGDVNDVIMLVTMTFGQWILRQRQAA